MTIEDIGIAAARGISNIIGRRKNSSPDFNDLNDKLTYHHSLVRRSLHVTHRHAKRLFRKHRLTFKNLKNASTKAAAGAALAGSLFVSPVHSEAPKKIAETKSVQAQIPAPPSDPVKIAGPDNPSVHKMTKDEFANAIKDIMGPNYGKEGKLSDEQLARLKKLTKEQFNIDIDKKTKNGFELNIHYAWSGREQHLPTHPGDTAAAHVSKEDPTAIASGLTAGKGAWGYVPAGLEEQYYVVGQTFLSDQFGTDASKNLAGQRYLTIQIPEADYGNNEAVVIGGIRDAGPGTRTGKRLGHAPAYFHDSIFGHRAGQSSRAHVIMLPILDDIPTDKLGPIGF